MISVGRDRKVRLFRMLRLFRMIIVAFVAVPIIISVGMLGNSMVRAALTGRATGTVIRYDYRNSATDENSRKPVVIFTVPTGDAVEFYSWLGAPWEHYEVGQEVPVVYDTADPSQAEIADFWTLWMLPLLFIGAGFMTAGFGFLITRRIRKVLNDIPGRTHAG